MARKNKRKKSEYRDRLGFNPRKYIAEHGERRGDRLPSSRTWNTNRQPRRGDIWFAELGNHPETSVQDGCRPVFIVSNDIGNRYADTINVLPMTRHLKRQSLPCHTQLDPEMVEDLRQTLNTSMILAEQVTTISKTALRHYTGHVADPVLLSQIDQAISSQLGLVMNQETGEEKGARV